MNKCQCGYCWISRVDKPKCCPSCKRYDWKKGNSEIKDETRNKI